MGLGCRFKGCNGFRTMVNRNTVLWLGERKGAQTQWGNCLANRWQGMKKLGYLSIGL